MTELRPVYDDDAASIKAVVLTSTLVIDYVEGGEHNRLHLTVDQEDLRALQGQLDRAEKKAQVLEKEVSQLHVPILIPGTD